MPTASSVGGQQNCPSSLISGGGGGEGGHWQSIHQAQQSNGMPLLQSLMFKQEHLGSTNQSGQVGRTNIQSGQSGGGVNVQSGQGGGVNVQSGQGGGANIQTRFPLQFVSVKPEPQTQQQSIDAMEGTIPDIVLTGQHIYIYIYIYIRVYFIGFILFHL